MGEAELYKLTYRDLILLVQDLQTTLKYLPCTYERHSELNYYKSLVKLYRDETHNKYERIKKLEFDLRRFSRIMVEDTQETVMKEYGTAESNVSSLEEYRKAHPRPMRGGGNPPEGDWLTPMVWGTEFLVRPKQQKTWMLVKFMMAGTRGGAGLVIPMRGDEPIRDDKEWLWVDPVEFCRYWELITVLLVPEEITEDE